MRLAPTRIQPPPHLLDAKSDIDRGQPGLGDIVAGVTRNIIDIGSSGTLVDLTGKVKFGTADAGKGLGTGQNDYAVQGDVTQSVTSAISVFGSLGYKFIGSPAGAQLNNVVVYGEACAAFKISEDFRVGAFVGCEPGALDLRPATRGHRLCHRAAVELVQGAGLCRARLRQWQPRLGRRRDGDLRLLVLVGGGAAGSFGRSENRRDLQQRRQPHFDRPHDGRGADSTQPP